MPSYIKTPSGWRVQICYKGKRYSKNFHSKQECQFYANKLLYELEQGINKRLSARKSVRDAIKRYQKEELPKRKGEERERKMLNRLSNHPIADLLLENATPSEWAKWRDKRLSEVKPATVRREITIIQAVYKAAINEWLWIQDSPITHIKKPKSSPSRDRRISPYEEEIILKALDYEFGLVPTRLKHFVALTFLFALETAMRSGEIVRLTWDNVFLDERFIHIPDSKNGSKRNVPLSSKAISILELLPKENNPCFNLTDSQRDCIFRKYLKTTEIQNLRFHDTRHEAITRLANKVNVLNLSRITGIKDLKTLMVYYNETASEIAKQLD